MYSRKYDSIDLTKLLLSFLVVAIHIPPVLDYQEKILAVARVSVPLFFMISGFLFFRKWSSAHSDHNKRKEQLLHFLRRIGTLYLSWQVLLMPVTIKYWSWYGYSLGKTVLLFIINLFIGETFVHSWFLTSLMLGIIIIAILSRHLSNCTLLSVALISYLICCAFSAYGHLLQLPQPASGEFNIKNSFFSSLIWIMIGKIISEKENMMIQYAEKKKIYLLLLLLLSSALYYLEYKNCTSRFWAYTTDELIFLIPLCSVLFIMVLSFHCTIQHASMMRTVSTVIYCFHGSLGVILRSAGRRVNIYFNTNLQSAAAYVFVLLICILLGITIYLLKHYKRFHFLSWFC